MSTEIVYTNQNLSTFPINEYVTLEKMTASYICWKVSEL